jgi:hypothetical protein
MFIFTFTFMANFIFIFDFVFSSILLSVFILVWTLTDTYISIIVIFFLRVINPVNDWVPCFSFPTTSHEH